MAGSLFASPYRGQKRAQSQPASTQNKGRAPSKHLSQNQEINVKSRLNLRRL